MTKTVKNEWAGIQRTDLIYIDEKEYVVVDADAKKDRTGSHLEIKEAGQYHTT